MSIKQNDRFFLENVFEMLRKPGQWYLDKAEGILYVIPNDGDSPAEYTVDGAMLETMISVDGANGISFENIIFRGNGFSYSVERDFSQAAYDATPCISYETPAISVSKIANSGISPPAPYSSVRRCKTPRSRAAYSTISALRRFIFAVKMSTFPMKM